MQDERQMTEEQREKAYIDQLRKKPFKEYLKESKKQYSTSPDFKMRSDYYDAYFNDAE